MPAGAARCRVCRAVRPAQRRANECEPAPKTSGRRGTTCEWRFGRGYRMSSDTAPASSGPRLCRSCRQPLPQRFCPVCGVDISHRYRRPEVCSPRCYHQLPRRRAAQAERRRRMRAAASGDDNRSVSVQPKDDGGDPSPPVEDAAPANPCKTCGQPLPERWCEVCGVDISHRRINARVCADSCYSRLPNVKEATRKRAREYQRSPAGKASKQEWLNRPGSRERARTHAARYSAKKRAERERLRAAASHGTDAEQ